MRREKKEQILKQRLKKQEQEQTARDLYHQEFPDGDPEDGAFREPED